MHRESWEDAGDKLHLELPLGSARPPRLLAQLWEDPDFGAANRKRVPKLGALLAASARAPAPKEGLADPAASGGEPLASAVVTIQPPAGAAAAAATGDGRGEMEMVLKGRAGLGKDYRVRFGYQISIW